MFWGETAPEPSSRALRPAQDGAQAEGTGARASILANMFAVIEKILLDIDKLGTLYSFMP